MVGCQINNNLIIYSGNVPNWLRFNIYGRGRVIQYVTTTRRQLIELVFTTVKRNNSGGTPVVNITYASAVS